MFELSLFTGDKQPVLQANFSSQLISKFLLVEQRNLSEVLKDCPLFVLYFPSSKYWTESIQANKSSKLLVSVQVIFHAVVVSWEIQVQK
jgi:hypothetical protein